MNNSVFLKEYLLEIFHYNLNLFLIIGVLLMSCEGSLSDDFEESGIINPADWVELHNPTDESITIGLWKFKDEKEDHVFIISEEMVIQPGQYLVLCRDTLSFKDNFPSIVNFAGDLGFGLSGGGELIRLFDSNGELVDSLEYDNSSPWPTDPDGNGPTLELLHPSFDNELGESWAASISHGGTPGAVNSVYLTDISNSIASKIVINEINYNAADE